MNTIAVLFNKASEKILPVRLYRYYIIDSIIIIKKHGFKELIKRRGWKFLLIIIGYYTVRDSVVYLLIPYLIAKGLL